MELRAVSSIKRFPLGYQGMSVEVQAPASNVILIKIADRIVVRKKRATKSKPPKFMIIPGGKAFHP